MASSTGPRSTEMDRSAWRVGKNAAARLAGQGLARLLSFVLVAVVARYEGSGGLGRYVLVLTVVGIANAVADVGLTTLLTREAARDVGDERQRELLGTILPLKSGLSVAGYGVLLGLARLAPFPQGTGDLLLLGGLALVPEALMGSMAALINARQRMEVTGALGVFVRALAVAATFPVLATGFGVAGVLVITAAASLVGAVLHGLVLLHWGLGPRLQWNLSLWRASLLEAYPFALTAVIALVYARLDLVLLSLWHGDVAAGWYSAGYKLWEAIGLIPASLLDALFPEMSRLSGSPEGMRRLRGLFGKGGRLMGLGGLVLAGAGTLTAGLLIPLVYGRSENYAPATQVFRLLVWAIPGMFLYLLSGHVLYALGRQRQVTWVMLAVGVGNVALNLVIIPRWSYTGAAVVALASEWLLWGLLYPRSRRAVTAGGA